MPVSVHVNDSARVFCVTRGVQVFSTEDACGSRQEYRLSSGVEDVYANRLLLKSPRYRAGGGPPRYSAYAVVQP
jgi:hypothetical protein